MQRALQGAWHPDQHVPVSPGLGDLSADVAASSHLLGSSKGLPYPCLLRAALIGALMAAAPLRACSRRNLELL